MAQPSSQQHWIGFDLGGTKMLAVVFDAEFKPVARQRKKTKGHEGCETGLKRIVQTIQGAMEQAEIDSKDVAGIGIGCAGPLDLDRGVIHEAPNLGWRDVPVKKVLEAELGCPVVVVNDVDSGLFGEYQFGSARGSRCALGVFPGTGIGGACVYEDRIIRGREGSCMEIGHIQVMPDGPICGCGQTGCLEAVASRLAIASAAAQAAYRGQAPHLLKLAGTNLTDIRSGVLANAIKAGDEVIEQIVRNAAEAIGTAVASVVHLLSPDKIVLGGGLVEAMPDLLRDTVRQTAKDRVLPSFKKTFEICVASLGDDATVLGAAGWARASQSGKSGKAKVEIADP